MARSLLLLSLILFACNNLEDANIPDRQTFIRFFGSTRSYTSAVVERDADGGFILAGNIAELDGDNLSDSIKRPGIIIVKTDNQGNRLWDYAMLGANVHSIKPLGGDPGNFGYLVTGEGIELNPLSSESSEFVNSQFLVMKIVHADGSNVTTIAKQFKKDSSVVASRGTGDVTLKVDFKAISTVAIDATQVATLGSYKVPGSQERTITMGFNLSDLSTPIWRKNLDLLNFDYVSAPFLGMSGTDLVWASTATPTDVNESKYLSVIAVPPDYASPSNNSLFGQNEDGGHDVKDFQPSATGFAAIGTYTTRAGIKNAFFVRIDRAGNVMSSSVRYFDCGATGKDIVIDPTPPTNGDKNTSISQEDGTAITYTSDGGFVVACSMVQTVDKGNGGTDIVLIKIDAFGNYKWDKLLGGGGNETATSVRELSDGTLLISGTSTISNVSSMFIIRTDANGDTKD
ncbi:MAG: hypothetical protein WDO15_10495 [Bacteroidota bacterium]